MRGEGPRVAPCRGMYNRVLIALRAGWRAAAAAGVVSRPKRAEGILSVIECGDHPRRALSRKRAAEWTMERYVGGSRFIARRHTVRRTGSAGGRKEKARIYAL